MNWFVPEKNGLPDFAAGAFAAPPVGVDCVEVSDQQWADYQATLAEPVRQWAELATRMNANIDWKRLVKSNGAAAELARYVSLQDVANARAYWLFLDSEGDLSESLKSDIAAAAAACNLTDLFVQITGET